MSKPHNEKRLQFVTARIKELEEMIAVLQKIIDNPDIGEKRIIDEMGLDFPKYRRFVYDLTWANKQSVVSTLDDDINDRATACWQELLWLAVLGVKSSAISVAPTDTAETIDAILSELSEREQRVIHMRFEDSMSLADCGKELGVTGSRIAQIERKAIARMKHRYNRLKLGDIKYGTVVGMQRRLEDDLAIKIRLEVIDMLDMQIKSIVPMIRQAYKIIQEREAEQTTKKMALTVQTPIANVDFSIRTYNCLTREGYRYLSDFYGKTEQQVKEIRNLGRKSYEEICEVLSIVGIKLL